MPSAQPCLPVGVHYGQHLAVHRDRWERMHGARVMDQDLGLGAWADPPNPNPNPNPNHNPSHKL